MATCKTIQPRGPSTCPPKYFPKRNGCIHSQKDSYRNAPGCCSHWSGKNGDLQAACSWVGARKSKLCSLQMLASFTAPKKTGLLIGTTHHTYHRLTRRGTGSVGLCAALEWATLIHSGRRSEPWLLLQKGWLTGKKHRRPSWGDGNALSLDVCQRSFQAHWRCGGFSYVNFTLKKKPCKFNSTNILRTTKTW